ncbi:helix-turn-helix domain-containing protein [Haloparvum alkalitolerans]
MRRGVYDPRSRTACAADADPLITMPGAAVAMKQPASRSDDPPSEAVFAALDDPACRDIVGSLDEPMTASEVADAASVPLSTTYKKLDRLTEADLVAEQTELHPGGHHRSRYVTAFDRLVVGLDERREFAVSVERDLAEPERQLLGMWSELRRET